MPQLPSIDGVSRVALQPSNSVATRDVVSYSNATAQGRALTDLGDGIRQVAAQEQAKLDSARVEDATTQLRLRELELTVGKEGYVGVKGGDVLKRQLSTEFGDQYRRGAEDIAKGLTPGQRAAFDGRAKAGFVQFQTGILKHSLIETERNQDDVTKAATNSFIEAAAKQPDNPAAIGIALDGLNQTIQGAANRHGIRDPVLLSAITKEARGRLHGAVIDSFIQSDNTAAASKYLAEVKTNDDATLDQVKHLESRLKPLNDVAAGDAYGVEAFKLAQTGKSQVDVALFLTEKTKGNARAAAAAENKFKDLQVAADLDERQVAGGYLKQVLQNPNSSAQIIKAVYADPALAQDPAKQARIVGQVQQIDDQNRNRQFSRFTQGRAYAAAAEDSPNGRATQLRQDLALGKLLDNPAIYTMNEEQLYSYAGELGHKGVRDFVAIVTRNKKEAGGFKLDKDILNDVATDAAGNGSDKADKKLAYKGYVARKFNEWQANNPGKKPSAAEEDQLIRSGALPFKKAGTIWGWNEVKAFEAAPDVVQANTPSKQFSDGLKAAAAKSGRTLTPEAVQAAWQKAQFK